MTSRHLAITMGDPAGIGPEIIVKACVGLKDRIATGDLRLITVVTAALWIPGLPLLPLVVAPALVWAAWERVRSTGLAAVVRSPATQWAVRGLLAVVFGAAVISLSNDIQTLV